MVSDIKVAGNIYKCKNCEHVLVRTDQPKIFNQKHFYILSKLKEVSVDEEFEWTDLKPFTHVTSKFWDLLEQEAILYTLKCKNCAIVIGLRCHAGTPAIIELIQRDMLYRDFVNVKEGEIDLNEIIQ